MTLKVALPTRPLSSLLVDLSRCLTMVDGRLLLCRPHDPTPHSPDLGIIDSVETHISDGLELARLGLWRGAIDHWRKAATAAPLNPDAHNNLAVGYEHEGLHESATTEYEVALRVEPNNVYIRLNYRLHQSASRPTPFCAQEYFGGRDQ